jgi:hypothetical protein
MLGHRHRLGAAEVNQPAEALLGVISHHGSRIALGQL